MQPNSIHLDSSSWPNRRVSTRAGLAAIALAALQACGGGGGSNGPPPELPDFASAVFSDPASIDNVYFGIQVGHATTFLEVDGAERQTIVLQRLPGTRVVQGIECVVVRDSVFVDGLFLEDTLDFYAEDDLGNVWYMGEEVDNYEYDESGVLLGIDHEGSWEAGLDVAGVGDIAQPGWALKGAPMVGDYYFQEHYPDEAEDIGLVLALNAPVTLSDGSAYVCLKTEDTSAVDPSLFEHKFYAPGVGFVLETKPGSAARLERIGAFDVSSSSLPNFAAATFTTPALLTNPFFPAPSETAKVYAVETEDGLETIVLERLGTPKTVLGVACAVVRDRVYLDGLLVEDTQDWYAQDDLGNVWYMGEAVDNYAYDENGTLLGIDHEGSWEAGLDVAGVGEVAQPGYQMLASPALGTSYYQEFYESEAEDMGLVSGVDVTVALANGPALEGCLRVVDWNPLHPDGLEYKYYAPGIGFVREEKLNANEAGELVGALATGASSIPNFGAASFSQSTLIDHPFFPLPSGATWTYEKVTVEGVETVLAEVLPTTRVVLGVTCVAVRVREHLDGDIIEDTEDWYAQDDVGNVWYMGESVINYEYDENGDLSGTNTHGSWEAGLDIAGAGSIAAPGHLMRAKPLAGQSYFQESYASEAEDMGFIVAVGVDVEVGDETYRGCLQVLDWTPLEPDQLEYKFYAPGLGLVLERGLNDDETLELQATSGL